MSLHFGNSLGFKPLIIRAMGRTLNSMVRGSSGFLRKKKAISLFVWFERDMETDNSGMWQVERLVGNGPV